MQDTPGPPAERTPEPPKSAGGAEQTPAEPAGIPGMPQGTEEAPKNHSGGNPAAGKGPAPAAPGKPAATLGQDKALPCPDGSEAEHPRGRKHERKNKALGRGSERCPAAGTAARGTAALGTAGTWMGWWQDVAQHLDRCCWRALGTGGTTTKSLMRLKGKGAWVDAAPEGKKKSLNLA